MSIMELIWLIQLCAMEQESSNEELWEISKIETTHSEGTWFEIQIQNKDVYKLEAKT